MVGIFPVPHEECYDIYNYISTPLFILAIQTTGGRHGGTEEILPEIIFISILVAVGGGGGGDPVKNHYIYLYSYKIKDYNTDCMPIY